MSKDTKELLERAVGWWEPSEVDPGRLLRRRRRRTRRHRVEAMVVAFALSGSAGLFLLTTFSGGRGTTGSETGPPPTSMVQSGDVVGTIPFSVSETELYAAHGSSLFVLVIPPGQADSIMAMRVDADGTTASRRLPFDLEYYLMHVSAGPEGVYAGTSVVKRFTDSPDELVRIDPDTLAIDARTTFPASVAPLQREQGLWASIGDGRVVSLDPSTLSVRASRRLVPVRATETYAASLSAPALGLGSLWVLARQGSDTKLVRMDPTTLAVLSETAIPRGEQATRVLADTDHVYLFGRSILPISSDGEPIGDPVVVPGLDGAEIYGSDLLGLTAGSHTSLIMFDRDGRILARTELRDAGADLAVDDRDAWFLGDEGDGNGIVHVRLAPPP